MIVEVFLVPSRCAAANLPPWGDKPEGSRCREWDGRDPGWAQQGPLCDTELRTAERDCRLLLWDVVDLEQMLPRPLSQAMDGQPLARPGPPAPLAVGVEALQAEITHVVLTWEEQVRAACGLPTLPTYGQAAPWHTTDTNRPPAARVRVGAAVQRATTILAPRIPELARLDAACVFRTGSDGDAEDVAGWEAVLQLSDLHARARAMLGRTRRTARLPGECSGCGAADLRRDEPRYEGDPCDVYCALCDARWTHDDYERYTRLLVWPGMVSA